MSNRMRAHVPDADLLAAIRGLYHAGRSTRPATWELEAACGVLSPDRATRLHRRLIETGEVPCLPAAPTRQTAIGKAEAAVRTLEIRERARRDPPQAAEGVWRRTIREAMHRERGLRLWAMAYRERVAGEATWIGV